MKAKIENMGKYALLVGCIGMFLACGGGGGGGGTSSTPPAVGLSGTVVQGVVSGAKVWADHKSGAEANFKMDASEAATATVTAADGTFTPPGTRPEIETREWMPFTFLGLGLVTILYTFTLPKRSGP